MLTPTLPWLARGERLICLGDSLTANPNGYVKLLQERLAAHDIEVVNAGRGGDKTPWAMTRLETDVIARRPAALMIFLGANDCAVGRGVWADEPMVTPEAFRSNLVWMIHLCRLAGLSKFSITPPLWRYEGASWAEFGDIMAPFCLAARQAADEMRVPLVPADTAFAEEWARHPGHTGLLLTTDGVHLTPRGNQLLVDTMLKTWGLG